eukprot:scaffold61298_cov61-Cyclotella_meneghiniana.AAC.1
MSKKSIEGTQGLPECSSRADSDSSNSIGESHCLHPMEFDESESAREEHSGSGRVNTQILLNVFGDASQENVSLQQEINNQEDRSQTHVTILHRTNNYEANPPLPPLPPVHMESALDVSDAEIDEEIRQVFHPDENGTRTKSNRYHKEGRGPQTCGKCGQPRKGHIAPSHFSTPHIEQCRKIRAQVLASFFMGVLELMKLIKISSADQVVNQDIITTLKAIAGQSKNEQSDRESVNSSQGEETRTVTERYHTEGRSLQVCNLCGKHRKNHL